MKRKHLFRQARRGNVIVLTAFLMVGMMAMIAFAVDLGYLYNARTEMQRAADASAIAACWELIDENVVKGTSNADVIKENARTKSRLFLGYNKIAQSAAQLANEDVTSGYIANPNDPNSPFL